MNQKERFWEHVEETIEGYGKAIDFLLDTLILAVPIKPIVDKFCGTKKIRICDVVWDYRVCRR